MIKRTLLLLFLLFFYSIINAGAPKIISAEITPINPVYGEIVSVKVTACANRYLDSYIAIAFSKFPNRVYVGNSGQVFVVSNDGVNIPKINPNQFGTDLGYLFAASDYMAVTNCTDCDNNEYARLVYREYIVNVPDKSYFNDCGTDGTLYLHIGLKDQNMDKSTWTSLSTCQSYSSIGWTQPILTRDFTIYQISEGTLQSPGDLILYEIKYSYQNGSGFRIEEQIPTEFNLVAYGPTSIPGGSVYPGPNIIWNFPDTTGQPGKKIGSVWALLSWNGTGSGPFINTVRGSWGGADEKINSLTTYIGQSATNIIKSQNKDQLLYGDTITYYLSYELNGFKIVNFQSFEDANGVYSDGAAPPGWKSLPDSGIHGTWTAVDQCNNGNKYIYGSSNAYSGLLLDDGNDLDDSDQFCSGMIVSDVMIKDATSSMESADAMIIIRSNGLSGSMNRSYGLGISVDNYPGYLFLQKCSGTSCNWPVSVMPSMGAPQIGVWYRVRIVVENSGSYQIIKAKVWKKGYPEPENWDINYTDTSAMSDIDWKCDGTGTYNDWRPGVNIQTGDFHDVIDAYDNFIVFRPNVSDSAYVEDDIPSGVTFIGCPNCVSNNPVRWNIESTNLSSGSFIWWGKVLECGTILNMARIHNENDIFSEWSYADVICLTPVETSTMTSTPTFTQTDIFTNTQTYTKTETFTNTMTNTMTFTPTKTQTITPTMTKTITETITPSEGPSKTVTTTFTFSKTPTMTQTITQTISETITQTITDTITPSVTNTMTKTITPTYTQTITETITETITQTVTQTSTETFTPTQTNTETYTVTSTKTATDTTTPFPTASFTYSATSTATHTFTETYTSTYTETATYTVTNTHTNTLTHTLTETYTMTYTATYMITNTYTNTETSTLTFTLTETATNTNTITITYTPPSTKTNTETATPSFTVTATDTETATNTETYTHTYTFTHTQTYTYTKTITNTYTETETFTITQTPTDTETPTITDTFTITETPTITNTPTNTPTPATNVVLDRNYVDLTKGEKVKISVKSEKGKKVLVKIYNLTGEFIKRFEFITEVDGWNAIEWDAKNLTGKIVGRGIYFLYIWVDNKQEIRRVYVIK